MFWVHFLDQSTVFQLGMSHRFLIILCISVAGIAFVLSDLDSVYGQTIEVGDIRDDQYRLLQLYSDSTTSTSFMNRTVWMEPYRNKFNEIEDQSGSWWARPIESPRITLPYGFSGGVYEPVISQTFNSALPYGGNNGPAWYGKGFTSELSGGVYLTSDYLTITFRPHFSQHQNRAFEEPRFIPRNNLGDPTYQGIVTGIDNPFRFGPDSFSTLHLGGSSVRVHYKPIEFGASTETLWWGPGTQNALVMSNNAPGIKHLFLGTRYPIKLPLRLGGLEFRFIGGWPEDSDFYAAESPQRYVSALHVVYSPSFFPNLYVGANRLTHLYVPESGLTAAEIFTSQPFAERQLTGNNSDQNEMASIFFRWVFPEASAEVYGSYFREDSFYDSRDLFLQIDHDRAYTIGFQKLIYFDRIDFVKVNLELSNLVPNRVAEVRPQVPYYRHFRIRQGHTNGGQILGAQIGPGSGSQYLGVDGYFHSGRVGFFLQRVEVNDFFHFDYYRTRPIGIGYKDIFRNRININYGVNGLYIFRSLMVEGGLVMNHNLNYGRFDYGDLDTTFETFEPYDILNVQLQFSVRYLF